MTLRGTTDDESQLQRHRLGDEVVSCRASSHTSRRLMTRVHGPLSPVHFVLPALTAAHEAGVVDPSAGAQHDRLIEQR